MKQGLEFLSEVRLPKMYTIRQDFADPTAGDIQDTVSAQLNRKEIRSRLSPGDRVAVGVGSRGIANLKEIVKSTVDQLTGWGVRPFITPAMGTHGGASPEGQKEILAGYGITSEEIGAEIRATTEVVELGTVHGYRVCFDRLAEEADAYLPINRIKPHTDFKSRIESGLMKMLVIGFGNPSGASRVHSMGVEGLKAIPEIACHILGKTRMAFGLAIVENAYDRTAEIRACLPTELEVVEAELLEKARKLMPGFPLDRFDLLIIDEIGKNISGTGMDTNVIGRLYIKGEKEPEVPEIFRIVALDLTAESHGNAIGVGLADYTTERLFEKIEFDDLRANSVTSTFLERAKIPLPLPSDLLCIQAALAGIWGLKPEEAEIIRIKNTLELSTIDVSAPIFEMIRDRENIHHLSGPSEFDFDARGNLF